MSSDRFNSNVDFKVKTEATPIRRIDPLIEIVLGVVTVRTRGSVDAKALTAVLRAVKAVA